jgi:Trypsin-co-occurring domain 1
MVSQGEGVMDEEYEYEVVRAELPGGGTVAVQAVDLGGAADVNALDALKFEEVANTIQTIASTIGSALKHSAPSKGTVSFGLQVAVESGKLTSLLVQGSGTATLNITLEWGG